MTFGALSWALSWTALRALPEVPIAGADWPLKFGLGLLQDQWLCLTYIGGIVLLLAYRPQWTERLRLFGEAGRMGLTNYLLQALVSTCSAPATDSASSCDRTRTCSRPPRCS